MCFKHWGRDSSVACGGDHGQVVCLQPPEDHVRGEIYSAAQGGIHGAAHERGLKEAAHHGEPTLHGAPGRNCRLWREAHIELPFFP